MHTRTWFSKLILFKIKIVFFLSIYSNSESGSNNNQQNKKLYIACIVKTSIYNKNQWTQSDIFHNFPKFNFLLKMSFESHVLIRACTNSTQEDEILPFLLEGLTQLLMTVLKSICCLKNTRIWGTWAGWVKGIDETMTPSKSGLEFKK